MYVSMQYNESLLLYKPIPAPELFRNNRILSQRPPARVIRDTTSAAAAAGETTSVALFCLQCR